MIFLVAFCTEFPAGTEILNISKTKISKSTIYLYSLKIILNYFKMISSNL